MAMTTRETEEKSGPGNDGNRRGNGGLMSHLLFASNPLPMWIYDLATTEFLDVNAAAVAHYGYAREEFLAMRLADIRPSEDVARLLDNVAEVREATGGAIRRDGGSWRHRLKDSRIRDVEIYAQSIDFGGRDAVLVVVNDVTDLKQTQRELARYVERLNLLHDIDKAIIAGETSLAIAEPAIKRLRELLDVPRAVVNLFDLEKNEAEWLVAVGRRRSHARPGIRFSLAYMGDVEGLRRGEVQTLETAKLPPGPETEGLLSSGVDVYMVVPMLAKGELIGGLSFGGAPGKYSTEQIGMAEEVAAELGIAITQGRLHDRVMRHAEELESRVDARTLELQSANKQLQEEIAERRRAQTEADRANRLKSEFLANMSHELRTPLNAILGFTELLHDGMVPPESPQFKEFLADILGSGRHLLQLINDILDLSKIEAGKLEFNPQAVDLRAIIGELLGIMRTTAAMKAIRVDPEISPDLTDVVIDAARLKQILYNYLSNALKFTPSGGRVIVRATPESDGVSFRLEVEDNGIGIAPLDMGRLFVEFQQLDSGVGKKDSGTGLGLALTKRLVEAQGGSVGVSSELGKGSTFHAVLPLRSPAEVASPASAAFVGDREASPTILVVEDEERDRAMLVETLVADGYAVDVATTGAQALAKCRERVFDAITLDLLLPDTSGLDVLRTIRSSTPNKHAPIIVITIVTEKWAVAGFTVHDIVVKPIDGRLLLDSLHRARISPGRPAADG